MTLKQTPAWHLRDSPEIRVITVLQEGIEVWVQGFWLGEDTRSFALLYEVIEQHLTESLKDA